VIAAVPAVFVESRQGGVARVGVYGHGRGGEKLTQDAHESCGGHQHAHVWDHTAMIAQRKHEVVRLDAVNEAVAFIIYTNPNFIDYLDLVRDNYEYIFQKSSTDTVIPQFPSQAQVFQRTEHIGMGGVECKMVSTCLSYVRELAYLESPI
jgi:hypothetical protein